jgi:phosphodiesterase/alkaline phosphatase D-like protein
VPQFQPLRVKRRLLARALDFAPDAMHANGDHVYWDMRSWPTGPVQGMSPQAALIGPGFFDRTQPVKGTRNEGVLKNAFGAQIADLYGVDWRSTPVYFVKDDHDYTENDENDETGRTFPPDTFMRDVARTAQEFFYPELFGGPGFPAELQDEHGLNPDFGTIRYGSLFEGLVYNAKGLLNNTRDPQQPDHNGNAGQEGHPESRMVPSAVEDWLLERTRTTPARHYAHIPSSPILWGAGKFAEWYPDVLGDDGHLTTSEPKPYWPDGWNLQHDRLLTTASARRDRVPLWISGDLHASALGTINRTNGHDLSANPVVSLCCGTPGTGTPGFPSAFRGVAPEASRTLDATEQVPAVEENGFSLVDFTPEAIVVSMFRWDHRTQSEDEIDRLEPFAVHRFSRGSRP